MGRTVTLAVCTSLLGVVALATHSHAQSSILFSGQPSVIVDTNGNGMPDPNDGRWVAAPVNGQLRFFGIQGSGPGTKLLRALSGDFVFNVNLFTPSAAAIQLASAPDVTPPIKPQNLVTVNASQPTADSTYSQVTIATANDTSGGSICSSNGVTAAQVTLSSGLRVNVGITPYPGSSNPTHVAVPVPLEETNGAMSGATVFLPAVQSSSSSGSPLTKVTAASSDTPTSPFLSIAVSGPLPTCSGIVSGVPSASVAALLAATLALLASGVWFLRRRPAFRGLALP